MPSTVPRSGQARLYLHLVALIIEMFRFLFLKNICKNSMKSKAKLKCILFERALSFLVAYIEGILIAPLLGVTRRS